MKLLIWEIYSYAHIPVVWYLFKRYGKTDVSGSIIAGAIIGCFLEFATEPLWTYHFRFTFYKDIAPSIILGWGVLFTLTVAFSEKLYRWAMGASRIPAGDKSIFAFDVLAACLIAFPMEAVALKSGVWDYNHHILNWDLGIIPIIEMPVEALLAYALLMLVAPTFVRRWRGHFALSARPAQVRAKPKLGKLKARAYA